MAPPKEDPISKEEYQKLKDRVQEVATQMGDAMPASEDRAGRGHKSHMKHLPGVMVRDWPDANANYLGSRSMDSYVDAVTLNKPVLNILTPREQKAVIAHTLAHREDFINGKAPEMSKLPLQDYELAADKKALEQWGDPKAYASAMQKMSDYNDKLSDRDIVVTAQEYGLNRTKNAARQYDKADDAHKADMVKEAKEYLNKKHDDTPLLETEKRIALANQVAAESQSPAIKARAEKDANLDAMTNAAKAITADASPETVKASLNEILKRSGQTDFKLDNVQTGSRAEELGKKLQSDIQNIRDEQPGYDNRMLSATILSQKTATKEIPELNTSAKADKPIDHAISKAGDLGGLSMLKDMTSPDGIQKQAQNALQKLTAKALG